MRRMSGVEPSALGNPAVVTSNAGSPRCMDLRKRLTSRLHGPQLRPLDGTLTRYKSPSSRGRNAPHFI